MFVKTLIVQKIDRDGMRRTAYLSANEKPIGINAPGEAQAVGEVPIYIEQQEYRDKVNHYLELEGAVLTAPIFQCLNDIISINNLECHNIPSSSKGNCGFSFYVLMFPVDAILKSLSVVDHNNKEYSRYVQRDDDNRRYVLYLILTNSLRLTAELSVDESGFDEANYEDNYTVKNFYDVNTWHDLARRDNAISSLVIHDMKEGLERQNMNGFSFQNGIVSYEGKQLDLPAGETYEILKKLVDNISTVVQYQDLNAESVNAANDQLRKNISQMKKSLQESGIPCILEAKRNHGYILRLTN